MTEGKFQTNDERNHMLHPNVQQIATVYRWRPFRRIRNLIEHLDTAYRALDDTERAREIAVRGWQKSEAARVAKARKAQA